MRQLITWYAIITKGLIHTIGNWYLPTCLYKISSLYVFYDILFLSILTMSPPPHDHTGQCKRTGDRYNELVVAFFSTGGGVKGKKSIPVDFIIYL